MKPLFFKAENELVKTRQDHRSQGFNGADFFQSGKHLGCDSERGRGGRASMEPLFFKAENSDEEEDMACDCDASMEPLFFKAENSIF